MMPSFGPFDEEALHFFCRLAIRQGIAPTTALQRWRIAGFKISDARFRAVFNEEKESMPK